MTVIKKDGTTEPFDFSKITRMIEGAVQRIDNGHKLQEQIEANFSLLVKDGISSTEIQEQIINTAKNLIDIDNTDMSLVAGRLLMSNIISSAEKNRGFEFGELVKLYQYNLENGLYEDDIDLEEYYKILTHLESHLDRGDNYNYGYASVASWTLRYLHRDETPVEVFGLIAARIALHSSSKFKYKLKEAEEYLKVLSGQQISLATPFLLNLRRKDGNLSSCFVMNIPDDLGKQYDALKAMAMISKNGGGIGAFIGNVRAKGSRIGSKEGLADSVIPFIKNINDTAVYVNQGGSRVGAVTVAIPTWHADIVEYLNLQTEVGESRRKAHDIFLQVVVDRTFIEAMENDLYVPIVCPLEVKEKLGVDLNGDANAYYNNKIQLINALKDGTLKVGQTIRAREIFKMMIAGQVVKGTPYVFFTDNVNEVNPLKDVAPISSTNLCVESTSAFNDEMTHTCNLVSLVLPNINLDTELKHVTTVATNMLDAIVDISTSPDAKAQKHNDQVRVLGIGAMGLHDVLAINKKTYEKDVDFIEDIFERISLYALEASIMLAKDKGVFPLYPKSEWAKGLLYSRPIDWYAENSTGYFEEWLRLEALQLEYGIRNLQLTAIAPNTSSSVLQGVTSSILPTYSKFHSDSSALGALPVFPKYIKEAFWYYKDYVNHDIIDMNTVISKVQKWVDSGISYEWSIKLDEVTITDIANYYIDAYKKKVKTVYYVRYIRTDGSSAEKEEGCVSCAD